MREAARLAVVEGTSARRGERVDRVPSGRSRPARRRRAAPEQSKPAARRGEETSSGVRIDMMQAVQLARTRGAAARRRRPSRRANIAARGSVDGVARRRRAHRVDREGRAGARGGGGGGGATCARAVHSMPRGAGEWPLSSGCRRPPLAATTAAARGWTGAPRVGPGPGSGEQRENRRCTTDRRRWPTAVRAPAGGPEDVVSFPFPSRGTRRDAPCTATVRGARGSRRSSCTA
jgi:hypothetical protein